MGHGVCRFIGLRWVFGWLVIFATVAEAQFLSELPPWVATVSTDYGEFGGAHPGLANVAGRWAQVERDGLLGLPPGPSLDELIWFHPMHGELIVGQYDATNGVFTRSAFDTGLDFIYSVAFGGFENGPRELVVAGQVGNVSRVLYTDWPPGGTPANWVFSTLVPDGVPGSRYLAAQIDGDELYVFDAFTELILRYGDGDADGIPDAIHPPATVDINVADEIGPVFGFLSRDGKVGVSFHPAGLARVLADWEVVESGQAGILELVRRSPHLAGRAGFLTDEVVAGQQHIPVYGGYLSTVHILSGPSSSQLRQVSGEYKVLDPSGIVNVLVSPPLTAGDVVKIVSTQSGDSEFATVSPTKRFMFPQNVIDDSPVADGGSVLLMGVNLDQDLAVSVDIEGIPVMAKATLMGREMLFLSSLAIPDETSAEQVMHIVVTHPDFPHPYEYWIGILR